MEDQDDQGKDVRLGECYHDVRTKLVGGEFASGVWSVFRIRVLLAHDYGPAH